MKNIFERLTVLAFSIFLVSPVSSFCQKKPALTKFSLDDSKRVGMSASNDTFIVGYVGDMTGRSFSSAGILHLLLFDWEGNLLRQIDLPEEVSSFDIDWQSGKVVAISKDDEPKILVAPIPIK